MTSASPLVVQSEVISRLSVVIRYFGLFCDMIFSVSLVFIIVIGIIALLVLLHFRVFTKKINMLIESM